MMIIKRIYSCCGGKAGGGCSLGRASRCVGQGSRAPLPPTAPSPTRVCTQRAHSPTRLPLCLSPSLPTLTPKAREQAGPRGPMHPPRCPPGAALAGWPSPATARVLFPFLLCSFSVSLAGRASSASGLLAPPDRWRRLPIPIHPAGLPGIPGRPLGPSPGWW